MNLTAYLDRIGFRGTPRADLDTLTRLHRGHVTHIPYENLDVQLGRPVSRAPAAIFHKLVTRRRGGWCFECAGARFSGALLRASPPCRVRDHLDGHSRRTRGSVLVFGRERNGNVGRPERRSAARRGNRLRGQHSDSGRARRSTKTPAPVETQPNPGPRKNLWAVARTNSHAIPSRDDGGDANALKASPR